MVQSMRNKGGEVPSACAAFVREARRTWRGVRSGAMSERALLAKRATGACLVIS